jgi:hypothetical protein
MKKVILSFLNLNELYSIVFVPPVCAFLLHLKLQGVLAILREELAYAPRVIAVQLVVVREAQELCHVRLRLPLYHLQQGSQSNEVLIAREILFIFELEENEDLASLVHAIEDLDNHRDKDAQVGQGAQDVATGDQGEQANNSERDDQRFQKQGEVVNQRVEDVRGVYPIHNN